jgi:flagellar hook assembly protein FlgD
MTLLRALILAALAAALLAPVASGGVRFVVRDQPVGAGAHAAEKEPPRFNMLGLHWRGSGSASFRTRSLDGSWSAWQAARPEAEDRPDTGTDEARGRRGWRLGNPYWTGPADALQYRIDGETTRVRAFFLWSPVGAQPRVVARAGRPGILRRAEWGADESIVRARPDYAQRVRFAVVHHTAGTNSYTAAQSAAIVRGIQRYHVLANGWNDIGYNFLVDKYGQVFEGRGGGIDRNVVGAHAQGFNTGSTGVAVLGTYSSARISRTARTVLIRLLAWRLDVAHVDPLDRLTWISAGNPDYPAGTPVRLRTVAGHRDTGPTSCPGASLYAQLPDIRAAIAARGLPKLYDPEVRGELGGPVRVTGRLSSSRPWTVTIRDEYGASVASGSGSGSQVDWTWDASAFPFGHFTYTVAAGPDVRPWPARVPGPPPLDVQDLSVSPRVVARDKDGDIRPARISFRVTTGANVTVEVLDGAGVRVRRLLDAAPRPRGRTQLAWNGRNGSGALVPSGRYKVRVAATSPGQSASGSRGVVADWTLAYLRLGPRPFSPNGDDRRDTLAVRFRLERPADVRLRVLRGTTRVRTLVSSDLGTGTHSFEWAGRNQDGKRVPDGRYTVQVEATTALGRLTRSRLAQVDTTPPTVRIVSAVADERTRVVVRVSERAHLVVRFGSSELVSRDVLAGETVVARDGVFGRVRASASDPARNESTIVTARVVRRD